jgi:NodT family efflux transporter outer membrane factor (OMF) lipoprotein
MRESAIQSVTGTRSRPRGIAAAASCALAILMAACTVGPNYHRPSVEVPSSFKEAPPAGWKSATPNDSIAKGNWWEVFGDAKLDELETQAMVNNPPLVAAMARVTQARAAVRITRADLYPTVTLDPSYLRERYSATRENPPGFSTPAYTANTISLPVDFGYEIDLWGRVRRSVESARAQYQGSEADYENILLTLKSDVAQNYLSLRYVDTDREILRGNIELLEKALSLTQVRHAGGVASGLDVSEAETLLATTQAQYAGLGVQRAQFEHALALLVGKPASEFSVPESPIVLAPPQIPIGLPSDLLERRPDIAESERQMASANAQIGVARAAFFPSLSLTGTSLGYESDNITQLFNLSSTVWTAMAGASQPLFEGGRLTANLTRVRAAYDETVANYREQVLTGFKEVEDGLSGLRVLEDQEAAQNKAVESAKKTADISTARYKEGLANYLEVIDAQRTVLENEELSAQLRNDRLLTTVQLVKALGGGWRDSKIHAQMQPAVPSANSNH